MNNLDIIKYLALNNPARLAELLDDIYCCAWNAGVYAANADGARFSPNEIDDFGEWINQEANTNFFFDHELEAWSKVDDTTTVTAFYDGLSVTFPVKDSDHMWNNNNEYDYAKEN